MRYPDLYYFSGDTLDFDGHIFARLRRIREDFNGLDFYNICVETYLLVR